MYKLIVQLVDFCCCNRKTWIVKGFLCMPHSLVCLIFQAREINQPILCHSIQLPLFIKPKEVRISLLHSFNQSGSLPKCALLRPAKLRPSGWNTKFSGSPVITVQSQEWDKRKQRGAADSGDNWPFTKLRPPWLRLLWLSSAKLMFPRYPICTW